MIYTFTRSLELSVSIENAWDFFSNPNNLPLITPPELNFQILSNPGDIIYPGQIIIYHVRPFLGIQQKWVTEITHVDAPNFFIDDQRHGPYSMWHHEHRFRKTTTGVIVDDIINYIVPFGPLGALAHSIFIKKKLNQIFNFRETVLKQKFGT